ncbi:MULTISPECIES: hypothetical protein [Pseudobacillus]|uniref:hypothetical protein n=1 Tax=Pseudobacillus TaxID=108525 RepID=UPI00387A36AE
MLYNDRKMMKWRGLLLSEHSEELQKKDILKEAHYIDEQEKEQFNRIVEESFHLKVPITVRLNTFGRPYFNVIGIVESLVDKNYLHLSGTGKIPIADIVSIDLASNDGERNGH